MRRIVAAALALATPARAAGSGVRLPVQVDQAGRTVDFFTESEFLEDVEAEAALFCHEHLRTVNQGECVANLVSQVRAVRGARL